VSLPIVEFLKLTEAKGILSSLCESWAIPWMIFVCAKIETLENRKIASSNGLYSFNGVIYRIKIQPNGGFWIVKSVIS
jgi:hypothetical protein